MAFLSQYSTVIKVAGLVGTASLLVAIACHILCLATPYYFILSDGDAKTVIGSGNTVPLENLTFGIRYGLWIICVDMGSETVQDQCYHMTSNSSERNESVTVPDWLTAPRALSIVGLLVAVVAVVSLVAFFLTEMERMPNFFLANAAGACILGGIIILSGDIAFAAEKTIAFYADDSKDSPFFPSSLTPKEKAYLIQQYDNRFTSGWSFILDLISGALCIASGPAFVFIALRLQWTKHVEQLQNKVRVPHGMIMTSKL